MNSNILGNILGKNLDIIRLFLSLNQNSANEIFFFFCILKSQFIHANNKF